MRFLQRRFLNDVDEDEDWSDVFKPLQQLYRGEGLKTDIHEKDGNYILEMEVPGYDKKNIEVTLEDGYLNVSVSRNESKEEVDDKKNYIKRERRYGKCSRSFYVGNVDEQNIDATYENGVLTIKVPKQLKQDAGKKQIDIK